MMQRLKNIALSVDKRLDSIFDDLSLNPAHSIFGTRAEPLLLSQVRDLTMRGGKRLRPALLVHGAALFDDNAENRKDVIDTAAALELFHTYLLIHDDIMDGDVVRRGGPTVHVALADKTGNPDTGYALGILAGDLAAALTTLVLNHVDADSDLLLKVRKILASMNFDVVHGQALDILGSGTVEEVAIHKTASYTTIGPLAIGATLGGATEQEIARLSKIALPLGIAFQYRDDILGTFGSQKDTGKSSDRDLKAGKKTVLIAEAMKRRSGDNLAAVDAVFGNQNASPEAISAARDAIVKCGAVDACQRLITESVDAFITAIDRDCYLDKGKSFLVEVARYIGARQS